MKRAVANGIIFMAIWGLLLSLGIAAFLGFDMEGKDSEDDKDVVN